MTNNSSRSCASTAAFGFGPGLRRPKAWPSVRSSLTTKFVEPKAGRYLCWRENLRSPPPAERAAWRDGVFAQIQAMTQLQGMSAEGRSVDRMCALVGVSRASYYRHWHDSAPKREETALRDVIQRLALAHKHYGYRRIGVLLRREGWHVNHKRVVRLMREDNLLCLRQAAFKPPTTDSNHNFKIYPNLARRLVPTAVNQLWVADITYVRLAEAFAYLAVILDAFSRLVVG